MCVCVHARERERESAGGRKRMKKRMGTYIDQSRVHQRVSIQASFTLSGSSSMYDPEIQKREVYIVVYVS